MARKTGHGLKIIAVIVGADSRGGKKIRTKSPNAATPKRSRTRCTPLTLYQAFKPIKGTWEDAGSDDKLEVACLANTVGHTGNLNA